MVELLSKAPLFESRTRLKNSRSCSLLLVCAIVIASSGCAQMKPSSSSDPIKRLDDIMDSSGYFFPRPQPNGGDAYGAAFVRNPPVIKGNELPAIEGAQSYGKRMLEGAAAARDCAKNHDPDTATACKEFVTKFCDRAQSAFELSQDETDWWRAGSPTFQGARSINEPPKLIPQTRLVACGIDKIQVVQGFDVGGTGQIATSVAAKKPKAKDATPVASGSAGVIAAAAPAPKEAKGVVATAPPLKKAESVTLLELPPAPKQEDAYPSKVPPGSTGAIVATTSAPKEVKGVVATAPPVKKAESVTSLELPPALKQEDAYRSKVAPQGARAKAVTAPGQVPDAGTEAFRNARPEGSRVAAVAPGSTGAIAAAAPAPKEVKGVVATAPPVKKAESATLVELPPAPKQEDAYPSKVAPQAARARAVTAPVASGSTGAIAAAAPAPKEAKGVVATTLPVKKAESATLLELPVAPKQEDAYPSKVAPQGARAKAVTAPVQVPDAGTEAFRNARPGGSQVAAVSGDESITDESQIKPQDNKSTPTNAPISSVVKGSFGGQVFVHSGGHSFSAGLILTLEGAGKELKGAWTAERGKSGILTGTLAGSKIAILRLKQLEPCAGNYDGSVVIVEDGSRLSGSYTGTDCKGQVDAAFTLTPRSL